MKIMVSIGLYEDNERSVLGYEKAYFVYGEGEDDAKDLFNLGGELTDVIDEARESVVKQIQQIGRTIPGGS